MAKQIILDLDTLVDTVTSTNVNVVAANQSVADSAANAQAASDTVAAFDVTAAGKVTEVTDAKDAALVDIGASKDSALVEVGSASEASALSAGQAAASAVTASDNAGYAEISADAAADSVVAATAQAVIATDTVTAVSGFAADAAASVIEAEQAEQDAKLASTEAEQARESALGYLTAINVKYDEFDDRYLGPHAVNPTTDNDGQGILEGALYWNITDKAMQVYTGAAWVPVALAGGALIAVNNLSDLEDKATARTNLGVESSAELDVRDTANRNTDNHTDGTTNGVFTLADRTKLGTIETSATADQTASEIEVLYEGLANTNKYTDNEKVLVDGTTGLTTTATTLPTAVNEHQVKLEAIHQRHLDVGEPTGFINKVPLSRGKMELCTNGTTIHGLDYDGSYYTNESGKFALGTIYEENATERTHAIFPADGQTTYDFYVQGTKYEHDTLDKIQLTATAVRKAIYFNDSGVLEFTDTPDASTFRDYAVITVIYGNPTTGEKVVHADERHGCAMPGDTHFWLHSNMGTQYGGGLGINGLVAGSTQYTSIDSGKIQDEDLVKEIPVQLNTPFWHIDTDAWRGISDGLDLAYIPSGSTRPNYSHNNGDGTFTLTEMDNNDYIIMHFMATNDAQHPVVKVLGQNSYNSVADAQAAIETEAAGLTLGTLPSPEFRFIYSVILGDNGDLRLLSDGTTYLDLRETIITGSGNISGLTASHDNLLNRDSVDSHPASAVSYIGTLTDTAALDVKVAIDEISAKLNGVEANAKDDQLATEVPTDITGVLSENTVQLALEALQTEVNTINEGVW